MADDDLILAELLCARLVHDLSGPVGAVANGAELLDEDETAGALAGEALELLSASAAAAVARLRFLRAALGTQGAPLASAELRRIAADYFAKGAAGSEAVMLDWPAGVEAGAISGRLLLNLLMLARDCLPRGGAVRIAAGTAGRPPEFVAEGPQAAPADAAKALGAPAASGLSPRGAQGYLTARLARAAGMTIAVATQPGRLTIALAPS